MSFPYRTTRWTWIICERVRRMQILLYLSTCWKCMAVAASCASEAKLIPVTYTHCLVSSRYVSRGCSIRQLWDFGERDGSGLKSSSPCGGEMSCIHTGNYAYGLCYFYFAYTLFCTVKFETENVPVEVTSTPLVVDVCVSCVYCKACHPPHSRLPRMLMSTMKTPRVTKRTWLSVNK